MASVDELCRVFNGYSFDRDFLTNQVAITDATSSTDPDHLPSVACECILTTPSNPGGVRVDEVGQLTKQIVTEEGIESVQILLQVLLTLLSSYWLRTDLFRAGYASTVNELLMTVEDDRVYAQVVKLVRMFYEFGLLTEAVQSMTTPAVEAPTTANINRLYHTISGPTSPSDFIIFNQPTTFPIAASSAKCFSVHLWYKLPPMVAPLISLLTLKPIELFRLGGNGPSLLVASIEDHQVVVTLTNSSTTLVYPFNQYLDDLGVLSGTWTHIVLTYDDFGNLNLFLQGDYSESMPCPELLPLLSSFTKVVMASSTQEMVVLNVLMLSTTLLKEWVAFLYTLGPLFLWVLKDLTTDNMMEIVSRINQRQLIELGYKLKRISHRHGDEHTISTVSKQIIIGQLTRLLSSMVLFDINDYYRACHDQGDNTFRNASYYFHTDASIHALVYAIGGTLVLLAIIESCLALAPHLVITGLDTLFDVLENNWRMRAEFENGHGYGMLLILLTKHRPAVSPALVDAILRHCGFDFNDPDKSLVVNKQCYRFIILANNFELWKRDMLELAFVDLDAGDNLESFSLLGHFSVLLQNKYRSYNLTELRKMRLLKRLVQFLKENPQCQGDEFEDLLVQLLRDDPTAELIRMLLLVVVALDSGGDMLVSALVRVLCDKLSLVKMIKKFSRLVSIHWLLLLFQDDANNDEVVCGGIRLLCRLLKLLGPHVIRKFFQNNCGTDVLVCFLRQWWLHDPILARLCLAGFGHDTGNAKDVVAAIKRLDPLAPLIIPEFMLVINGIVGYSLYNLLLKRGKLLLNPALPIRGNQAPNLQFEVGYLINHYIDMVREGFHRLKQLHEYFVTKEWLESAMEIVGYLHTISTWADADAEIFAASKTKFSKLLAEMVMSKVSTNDFTGVFNRMSDFPRKMVLEMVLPEVFNDISQFVVSSNFIYNEKQFLMGVVLLLEAYQYHLDQNFLVDDDKLTSYLECVVAVAEIDGQRLPIKHQLGKLLLRKLVCNYDVETLKFMLYRQMVVFLQEVLDTEMLGKVVAVVLGRRLTNDEGDPYVGNFLRTAYLMNQSLWKEVISLVFDREYVDPIVEFSEKLTSQNDEDSLHWLRRRDPVAKHVVKVYHKLQQQFNRDQLNMGEMITLRYTNGGVQSQLQDNKYVSQYVRDSSILRKQILHNDFIQTNRWLQDHRENVSFFVNQYNSAKVDVLRWTGISQPKLYAVDAIENSERMRERFILEEQLLELERLNYHVEVPVVTDTNGGLEELFLVLPLDPHDELQGATAALLAPEEFAEDKNRKVLRSLFMGDQILALWNISQVHGMVLIELLMILATQHLYLIENYFCTSDGNIVDVDDVGIDQRDAVMGILNTQGGLSTKGGHRSRHWPLSMLANVSKRQFLLRDVALELFSTDGSLILMTCQTTKNRDQVYNKLVGYTTPHRLDPDLLALLAYALYLSNGTVANTATNVTLRLVSAFLGISLALALFNNVTKKWRQGRLSNFYYLMLVNTVAGRTFNDLSQYPVFPWVIADYTSETLDLSDPKLFRDFSKPMGAQTANRAAQFQERYLALASLSDPDSPPFHYGTHYSSAMIVLLYLIRTQPYVQLYLLLQGGKFDHADRLFSLVQRAWLLASCDNTTDVRELIPEFFFMPEFLVNENHFDLGKTQLGVTVNDVALPPWAHGDAQVFIDKNREALELPYVLAHLHQWIDLIFGYKQTGEEARKAVNVFHHTSYAGATNLDDISDDTQRRAVIGMINNFGQTPVQVFSRAHSQREVLNSVNRYLNVVDALLQTLVFTSKLNLPIKKLELKQKRRLGGGTLEVWVGRPRCVTLDGYLVRKSRSGYLKSLIVDKTTYLDVHDGDITAVTLVGINGFVLGDEYGLLKMWKYIGDHTPLEFKGMLRGHTAAITDICYCPSFKLGLSMDASGIAIVWDMIRLKFIRQLTFDSEKTLVLISPDTGNMAFVYSKGDGAMVEVYTVNGHRMVSYQLPLLLTRMVTAINFGRVGNIGDGDNHDPHVYWSSELLAVAIANEVQVYEVVGGGMQQVDVVQVKMEGEISAIELIKSSKVDMEDRLCRGQLYLVVGTSKGKVYKI